MLPVLSRGKQSGFTPNADNSGIEADQPVKIALNPEDMRRQRSFEPRYKCTYCPLKPLGCLVSLDNCGILYVRHNSYVLTLPLRSHLRSWHTARTFNVDTIEKQTRASRKVVLMEILTVVHPGLDEYAERIRRIANKYGCENWFDLACSPEKMNMLTEADRSEFLFIQTALGDQLIHREFFGGIIQLSGQAECENYKTVEPEPSSGSTVFTGVRFDTAGLRRTHRPAVGYVSAH